MTDAPQTTPAARDYRGTVFLPRTAFPMKGDLPKREPQTLERWKRLDVWRRLRERSRGRPPFVLHDGPPYANGHLHIGHALNKILKDAINRAHQMAGEDARYIPGWDCHGLPAEVEAAWWKLFQLFGRDRLEEEMLAAGREFEASGDLAAAGRIASLRAAQAALLSIGSAAEDDDV